MTELSEQFVNLLVYLGYGTIILVGIGLFLLGRSIYRKL